MASFAIALCLCKCLCSAIIISCGIAVEERYYLGNTEFYSKFANGKLTIKSRTNHIMDDTQRIATINTQLEGDTTLTTTVRYQYANHLGSACLELDEIAKIISYQEYHPYGSIAYSLHENNTDVNQQRYKFTGKERDSETGLDYFGARYYQSDLSIWLSVDPLASKYPSTSPYMYVRGNPIMLIDPDGMGDDPAIPEDPPKIQGKWATPVIVHGTKSDKDSFAKAKEILKAAFSRLGEANRIETEAKTNAAGVVLDVLSGDYSMDASYDQSGGKVLYQKSGGGEGSMAKFKREKGNEEELKRVEVTALSILFGGAGANKLKAAGGIKQIAEGFAKAHDAYKMSKSEGASLTEQTSGGVNVPAQKAAKQEMDTLNKTEQVNGIIPDPNEYVRVQLSPGIENFGPCFLGWNVQRKDSARFAEMYK